MLVWSTANEAAIREVNAYIHTLADAEVVVLESAALLSDSRGLLRPEYMQDFLHPNDAAYAVLNEALVKLLE
jgi:hypothetical protein